ncbi:DUF4139 domain-containing protein [Methanosarcinaceae archaeon]|nr:DUF4139 domain-containing protein [Methanosarcinaceae archaeon]
MTENENNIPVFHAVLKEATVYYDGAELIHTADITLKPGEHVVRIDGLSPDIDEDSLKIGAGKGILVSSYNFVSETSENTDKEKVQALKDELRKQQDRKRQFEAENRISREMRDFLADGMKQKTAPKDNGSISLGELSESMDYYKAKCLEIENDLKKNDDEIEKCNKESADLREKLGEFEEERGYILLNLASQTPDTEISCSIRITYCTDDASWTPYYNINVESIESPMKIVSKAKVSQETGIDWKDVKLSLSSGAPANGKSVPELSPWFLREKRKAVPLRAPLFAGRAAEPMEDFCLREALAFCPAPEEPVMALPDDRLRIDDNALLVTYSIDIPYTIPGNGEEQIIDIRAQQAEADYHFCCIPGLDPDCYLTADVINAEKLDLPAGKAVITYDGTYLGETEIRDTETKLSLTLGTDKRIVVKREKIKDVSSQKSLLGSTVTKTFLYRMTAVNNQKQPVRLTIKDRYPISTNKAVEIELLKETTTPSSEDKETGIVSWDNEIAPGEEIVFRFGYSVKYPKDMDLDI